MTFNIRKLPVAEALAVAVAVVVLTGPWLAPHDPLAVDLTNALAPPSADHWAGTDQLGRDVMSRVLTGGQTTVGISLAALFLSALVGIPIGLYSGLIGKRTDWTLMRFSDTFMAFPEYVVAIVVTGLLGPGFFNLLLAIVVVKWVGYARLARSVVIQEKSKDYLMAARISGAGNTRIIVKHMFPHAVGPMLALAALDLGKVVLLVASLSFLGLGVPQPSPEWGSMLSEGRTYFSQTSMLMLAPGLAIFIVVLIANIVGDRLTEKFSGAGGSEETGEESKEKEALNAALAR
ncbi:nickel transporter permease [Corynebacterium pacaense]|uniref:nickel transporter permease n=1 Tax=Corynebacterium pacaense TaxID=1816684 RepID=UPI0009B98FF3|nr:nickel transporter permease [Corynebacterium pacaense]